MNKKKRSDSKRMKSRANRKLKRKYLHEHVVFDQPLVEKSNTKNQYWEKEMDYLRLELKYLKDAYETKKKII